MQIDFAAYIGTGNSIYQVGSYQELLSGIDYGDTPLVIESPEVNGTIVSYVLADGVIGNTYLLSFFINDGQLQDVQIGGFLAIIPDSVESQVPAGVYTPPPPPPPPPVVVPEPTVTLAASPTILSGSGSVTLTWTSTDATSVVASGGWNGNLALSGAQSSGTLTSDTTFTVTAMGPGGGPVTASVTITVNPVVVPPLFAAHVHVTAMKTTGENQYGFFITPVGYGSVSPANMPSGGSALGLQIQAIYSQFVGADSIELGLALAANDNVTQTNQFDSVSVVDDTGATRTFTAAGATYPGGSEWMWYGSNFVMQTNGKTYDFVFTKQS